MVSVNNITCLVARMRVALDDMDDFARMADIEPIGPYNVLKEGIDYILTHRNAVLEEAALTAESKDVASSDCPVEVQSCIVTSIRSMKK